MHDESTSGEVVPGGAAKHASAAVDADAYATAALLAEELAEDYELTDLHLPRATSNVSAETTTARVAEIRASADAATEHHWKRCRLMMPNYWRQWKRRRVK